jgi:hypothetical protein
VVDVLGGEAFVDETEQLRVAHFWDGGFSAVTLEFAFDGKKHAFEDALNVVYLGLEDVHRLTTTLIDFLRARREPGEAALQLVDFAVPQLTLFGEA